MSRPANRAVQCSGKVPHITWDSAKRIARNINRAHDGARVEPYHCPHCGLVHIGNSGAKGAPRSFSARMRNARRERRAIRRTIGEAA